MKTVQQPCTTGKSNSQKKQIMLPEQNYLRLKGTPTTFKDTISYTDFKTASQAVLKGILTPLEFKEAQLNDEYCQAILRAMKKSQTDQNLSGLKTIFTTTKDDLVTY